jgi:hypothetical protein
MGGDIVERRTVTKPDGTVAVYEKKSRPEWQAATWWLERKFPNDWAKVDRVQQMPCDEPRFGPNFIIIEDHVGSSIELSRADEAIDVNPDTSQQNLTCGAVSLPLRPAYGKR